MAPPVLAVSVETDLRHKPVMEPVAGAEAGVGRATETVGSAGRASSALPAYPRQQGLSK